ncbi:MULTISPECIES: WYL domain-containing protein [Bhargavaea]|uniref:WYL domain-containing protein n=1 Tax=Bhargavaea changchunensis TaxID=2134037 RepID=A0ABW2NKY3_9BACL|nr:WYL domain-containing protein [Bhargavaea sp. CC-171006]
MHGLLMKCMKRHQLADMIYIGSDGSITKRRVRLLRLREDSVTAYCFLRQERRTFKIDRILSVRPVYGHEKQLG